MEVQYRKAFLKDLKKLKGQPIYERIFTLSFTILPELDELSDLANVKALKGYPGRYRIRVGAYRVGIERFGDTIEVMRVLHRRDFYHYFP